MIYLSDIFAAGSVSQHGDSCKRAVWGQTVMHGLLAGSKAVPRASIPLLQMCIKFLPSSCVTVSANSSFARSQSQP